MSGSRKIASGRMRGGMPRRPARPAALRRPRPLDGGGGDRAPHPRRLRPPALRPLRQLRRPGLRVRERRGALGPERVHPALGLDHGDGRQLASPHLDVAPAGRVRVRPEAGGPPRHQRPAACRERGPPVLAAGPGHPPARPGRGGGPALRPPPAARAVGGLDRRAQGRAEHALLVRRHLGLRAPCGSTFGGAMDAGDGALRARAHRPSPCSSPFPSPCCSSTSGRSSAGDGSPSSWRRCPGWGWPWPPAWSPTSCSGRAGPWAGSSSTPLPVRLGNAVLACGAYLRKTVWPSDLAVFYPHPGRTSPGGRWRCGGCCWP
jgi:hypothetical protein